MKQEIIAEQQHRTQVAKQVARCYSMMERFETPSGFLEVFYELLNQLCRTYSIDLPDVERATQIWAERRTKPLVCGEVHEAEAGRSAQPSLDELRERIRTRIHDRLAAL